VRSTALMFQAPPTTAFSDIMARQLGVDAPLRADMTAIQTLIGFAAS
jgi:hypothetical protein